METKKGGMESLNSGDGLEISTQETKRLPLSEEELAKLPPELRPDANGNPPTLTPKLLKKLRGKYFTIRHVILTNCGHKLNMINQPSNNCENCWFQFFNTHPQLVEITDQFFRVHGKGSLVGMRGKKYFKMFVRYMATVVHFMKEDEARKAEEEKANESNSESRRSAASCQDAGEVTPSSANALKDGQTKSD